MSELKFKVNNLEIDEEGNLKVDLPEESIEILSLMFPSAKTPTEAFKLYLSLAVEKNFDIPPADNES